MRLPYGKPTLFLNGSGTANAENNSGGSAGSAGNGEGGSGAAAGNAGGAAAGNAAPATNAGAENGDTVESLRTRLAAIEAENATFKSDAESRRTASLTAEQQATERADRAEKALVSAEIRLAAQQAGAVDADTVRLLIDPAKITRDANGVATNMTELVAAVLEAKPFLKAPVAGQSGPNPPAVPAQRSTNGGQQNSGNTQTFTTSQIGDPTFYRANEQAILQAVKDGRIIKA